MSIPKKLLAGQLAAAVAPHLPGADATAGQVPKAVAKTLRQLAKQLTKQHSSQAKTVVTPAPLTAKRARKALVNELATALQPFLGTVEDANTPAPKSLRKAVKRLATQLVKQRRKLAKQNARQAQLNAKQTAKDAKQPTKKKKKAPLTAKTVPVQVEATAAPAAKIVRSLAPRVADTPARRPAAAPTKRIASSAAVSVPAATESVLAE